MLCFCYKTTQVMYSYFPQLYLRPCLRTFMYFDQNLKISYIIPNFIFSVSFQYFTKNGLMLVYQSSIFITYTLSSMHVDKSEQEVNTLIEGNYHLGTTPAAILASGHVDKVLSHEMINGDLTFGVPSFSIRVLSPHVHAIRTPSPTKYGNSIFRRTI